MPDGVQTVRILGGGGGADVQYTDGATQATPTGTVALGKTAGNVVKSLALDASGNLNVNLAAGSISGGNGAASATGSAVPSQADYLGVNIGGNLRGVTGYDADSSGTTHEYALGVMLRKSASGGSVEAATSTNPLRTDPTGTTTQPVSGTVTANVGTTNGLALDATLTGGTQKTKLVDSGGTNVATVSAAGAVKVDGSAVSQPVVGAGAAGATPTGNPLRNGVLGRTTLPTAVSAGQLVDVLADRYGRQFRVAPVLSNASSAGTAVTTATNTQLVAAPSAGNHLRVHRVWAQNSSATGSWCYLGNGSGVKTIPFYLGQYQPMMMNLQGSWELSSATALFLNTATGSANIEWYVEYETLTD